MLPLCVLPCALVVAGGPPRGMPEAGSTVGALSGGSARVAVDCGKGGAWIRELLEREFGAAPGPRTAMVSSVVTAGVSWLMCVLCAACVCVSLCVCVCVRVFCMWLLLVRLCRWRPQSALRRCRRRDVDGPAVSCCPSQSIAIAKLLLHSHVHATWTTY